MKIDALTRGHRAVIYMERYVNENTKTYSPFASRNEAERQYQPRSGQETFDLVIVNAPKARVRFFRPIRYPAFYSGMCGRTKCCSLSIRIHGTIPMSTTWPNFARFRVATASRSPQQPRPEQFSLYSTREMSRLTLSNCIILTTSRASIAG